jgi:hypothetical protein
VNDPNRQYSAERAAAKEEFAQRFATAPVQRRILLTGAVSVIVMLGLAGTGRIWLLAITAICFLLLFTFERMIYVTLISRRDQELKVLRETKV